MTPHTQLDPSGPLIPDTIELVELVDNQTAQKNGIDSTVDLGNGQHVHKAKVLHEFTRSTRILNSTDHLRQVANISHFTQPTTQHQIGNGSITETDCLLIQDPVAVLLQCKGIPFLGIGQINSIKIDKSNQNFVLKDLLREETASIGVQVLHLRGLNVVLPNGKDGNWVWEYGQDMTTVISRKFIQQVNSEIIEIETTSGQKIEDTGGEEALKKAMGYGFHSDEL